MTSKVKNHFNHYFKLWRTKQRPTSEEQGDEWMYGFDVKAYFPKQIAEGWVAAMKNVETRCVADALLPDDEGVALYKILKVAQIGEEGQSASVDLMEAGEGRAPFRTNHQQLRRNPQQRSLSANRRKRRRPPCRLIPPAGAHAGWQRSHKTSRPAIPLRLRWKQTVWFQQRRRQRSYCSWVLICLCSPITATN